VRAAARPPPHSGPLFWGGKYFKVPRKKLIDTWRALIRSPLRRGLGNATDPLPKKKKNKIKNKKKRKKKKEKEARKKKGKKRKKPLFKKIRKK
jgi:hypothetical protein